MKPTELKNKPKRKNQPPSNGRGKGLIKDIKRKIIARGLVRGRTDASIAKEAGCSTRHVRRIMQETQTKLLITELMAPHRRALAKCIPDAITAISRSLHAKKQTTIDHYAQLQGAAKLQDYLELAQGKIAEAVSTEQHGVTWEQFCVLYAARKTTSCPVSSD